VRCPYCHDNITVQGRFCPKCGEQIFGRPVARGGTEPPQPASTPGSWEAPSPQAGGDVLEIELEDAAEAVGASDNTVGQMCPFCRFPIKQGEEVITCPDCQTTLHADCWRENDGCTTYGCSSSPQAAAVRRTTGQAARGGRSWPGFGGTTPGTIPLPLGARLRAVAAVGPGSVAQRPGRYRCRWALASWSKPNSRARAPMCCCSPSCKLSSAGDSYQLLPSPGAYRCSRRSSGWDCA